MTAFALALVLVSAVAHASWNLLAKRSGDALFLWRLNASLAIAGAPLVVAFLAAAPLTESGWVFAVGTGVLHVIYFVSLQHGYVHGDLSLVYPIVRGTGPLLVALLAPLVFAELPTVLGATGIALIMLGIYGSHLPSLAPSAWAIPLRSLRYDRGSRYALVAGVIVGCYTLWDRAAVATVPPLLFGYFPFAATALAWTPFVIGRRQGGGNPRRWLVAAGGGLLSYGAYALVLTAFTLSKVSYVAATREVGIVFGALLGTLVLGEKHGKARLAGSVLICLGVILIALAK